MEDEKKIHILMIDDEEDFLEPMEFWFKSRGFNVSTATTGEEGIEKIKENIPDIVFLDIRMPGISGVETLQKIREFNKELPVIMVTAFGTADDLEKSREYGISGFFPKEADFQEAVKVLQVALRRHKGL